MEKENKDLLNPCNNDKIWGKNFTIMLIAAFFISMAFYFMLPTLPQYIGKTLHTDNSGTGVILAFFTIAALLARPFTGYFLDIYNKKWVYASGVAVFGLSFLPYFSGLNYGTMLALRLVHGLAWGVLTTASSTIVVELVPVKKRGEGLGYYGLAMTGAMALGPFVGSELVQNFQFPTMFVSSFAMVIAAFLLITLIQLPGIANKKKAIFSIDALFEKSALPVSLVTLIIMITYGSLLSFIAIYAKQIGIENAGLFFLIFAAGITLSRLTAGKIFDTQGPKKISVVGLLMLCAGFLILGLLHIKLAFYGSAIFLGMGVGIIFPITQAMVNNLCLPSRRGAANSTLFTALDFGIGIGMIAAGALSDIIGLPNTYLVCAGLNLIAMIIFTSWVIKDYLLKKDLMPK